MDTPEFKIFLSTPSARRATAGIRITLLNNNISIHALREEGDGCSGRRWAGSTHFYPRPPRGGRLLIRDTVDRIDIISIHALREEGDLMFFDATVMT